MNKNNQIIDPEEKIEIAINKTESFIEKNFKNLLIGVAVIIVVTGVFFGYKYLYSQPRDMKAAAAIFTAEQYFQVDSFEMALNGSEQFDGFLTVISDFGSTSVGNIAKHYAGICYFKMGDYDNALALLKQYNTVDGKTVIIINAQNIGLQGDIMSEKGSFEQAISLYQKAAAFDNNLTSPIYLKKAGMLYEKAGNKTKALELYSKIKTDYPNAQETREIDKFIGRVEE